jgi:peptidoglycan/LPS O-acetylase OafA/YrhL
LHNFLNRFSRITTAGREFIPQIDGLRFLALTSVIAFHVLGIAITRLGYPKEPSDLVGKSFVVGCFGVQLFFTISGFILVLPFAKQYLAGGKPVRLRDYFVRRLTRIEPPYIIQMVLVFLYFALIWHRAPGFQPFYGSEGWLRYTAPHALASLVYTHNLIYGYDAFPNIVLWSLEIEVQFYILAPLLARVFAIRRRWIRMALVILVMLFWPKLIEMSGLYPVTAHFGLLGALPDFLSGFLLADLYLANSLASANKNFFWDVVFFLCAPALIVYPAFRILIFFTLFVATFRGRIASRLMSNLWITTIGGMCYTIYMYHFAMIHALIRGTIHLRTGILWLDLLVQFIVLTLLIIVLCALLFAWFERPFMRRDWPARFRQTVARLNLPLLPKIKPPPLT